MLRNHLEIIKSNVKVFELSPPLVATAMANGLTAKSITPEKLVKGLKGNKYKIRVGDTWTINFLSKFLPEMAWGLINKVENSLLLKP